MLSKRCFNRLVMSMILMILVCAGAQVVMCQDSAKTWKDNATGLLWSVKDNGSEVTWGQASNYCRNLALEGNKDWRLPTEEELETIYDKNLSKQLRSKGPIELSSDSVWTDANGSGEASLFSFFNGGSSLVPTRGGTCNAKAIALCVRRSK
jgi:hypothetical protein